jgi:prephenate dehydratase
VELEHKSGTLRSLLDLFADRGINMLWVQTRPIVSEERGGRWEYAFFLEFEGHVKNESLATVYSVLGSGKAPMLRRGRKARLLGSYPNRLGRIDGT